MEPPYDGVGSVQAALVTHVCRTGPMQVPVCMSTHAAGGDVLRAGQGSVMAGGDVWHGLTAGSRRLKGRAGIGHRCLKGLKAGIGHGRQQCL